MDGPCPCDQAAVIHESICGNPAPLRRSEWRQRDGVEAQGVCHGDNRFILAQPGSHILGRVPGQEKFTRRAEKIQQSGNKPTWRWDCRSTRLLLHTYRSQPLFFCLAEGTGQQVLGPWHRGRVFIHMQPCLRFVVNPSCMPYRKWAFHYTSYLHQWNTFSHEYTWSGQWGGSLGVEAWLGWMKFWNLGMTAPT